MNSSGTMTAVSAVLSHTALPGTAENATLSVASAELEQPVGRRVVDNGSVEPFSATPGEVIGLAANLLRSCSGARQP